MFPRRSTTNFETMAPRFSGSPMIGCDVATVGETGSSWFTKIVRVPLRFLCAPVPSGIPTIWYCLAGSPVSGTVSPTEMRRFVSYPLPGSCTVYRLTFWMAAPAKVADTTTANAATPTIAGILPLCITPPVSGYESSAAVASLGAPARAWESGWCRSGEEEAARPLQSALPGL